MNDYEPACELLRSGLLFPVLMGGLAYGLLLLPLIISKT